MELYQHEYVKVSILYMTYIVNVIIKNYRFTYKNVENTISEIVQDTCNKLSIHSNLALFLCKK